MTDLAKLGIKVEYKDVEEATDELEKLKKQSGKTERATNGFTLSWKKAGVAMAGATAAIAAAVALTEKLSRLGQEGIDTADSIGKVASRLGLTAEKLQEYRILADAAGVSTETFDMGMQRFSRRLGEVARGMDGSLAKAFKELDINIRDQNGNMRETADIFDEYATKISELSDNNKALSLTMAGVDSEGVKMINMFRTSREEQEKLIETARRYGAVINNEVVASAERWKTELGLIQKGQSALETQTKLALAPITLEWSKVKQEIAFATMELLSFFGVIDDNSTLTQMRVLKLREELEKYNEDLLSGNVRGRNKRALQLTIARVSDELAAEEEKYKKLIEIEKEAMAERRRMLGQDTATGVTGGVGVIGVPGATGDEEEFQKSKELLEMERQQAERERMADHLEEMLVLQGEYREQVAQEEQESQDKIDAIKQKARDLAKEGERTFWGDIISLGRSKSKTLFEIGKVGAISQALLNAKKSAVAAWDAGMSTGGPMAPVVAAAYAGASILKTGAMIADLKSTSFGGGGSAGGGGGGGGGTPAAATAAPPPDQVSRREVSMVVSGGLFSDEDVRNLISRMGQVQEDMGGDVVFVTS